MMTSHQLFATKKYAHIVMCMLLGVAEPGLAGPRDAPAGRDAKNTTEAVAAQAVDDEAQEMMEMQTLSDDVSYEERVLLRRDLDAYSRSANPDYILFEERRSMMRKQIQERFFAADHDGDGSLSRVECAETLPQVARHFSEVDLNADEAITIDELATAQAKAIERQRMAEAKLEEARLNEIKEAERQAKRKSKQVNPNRKSSL